MRRLNKGVLLWSSYCVLLQSNKLVSNELSGLGALVS